MENGNGESKIRKVLFNEVALFVGAMGFVLSIVFWIVNPQQNIELRIQGIQKDIASHQVLSEQMQNLKDNDLHSITVSVQKILDNQSLIFERIARIEATLKIDK